MNDDILLEAAHCIERCWTLIRKLYGLIPVESQAELRDVQELLHDCNAVLLRIHYNDPIRLREELSRRLSESGLLNQDEIELLKDGINDFISWWLGHVFILPTIQ